jgi:hypothetical protein
MLNAEGFDDDEDEVASTKSGQSVSDYEGDLKHIPPTMYFGEELCRAQFLMTGTGDMVHVCGKQEGKCRRPGHRVFRNSGTLGPTGYYDTLCANTTIDGDAATYMTHSEMAVKLANQHASNLATVETLFGSPRNSDVSPSAGSWTLASGDGGPVPRLSMGADGTGAPDDLPSETQRQVQPTIPPFENPTVRFTNPPPLPMHLPTATTTLPSPFDLIPDGMEETAAALALERAATRAKIAELSERLWALNTNEPPPPSHPGSRPAPAIQMPTYHRPVPPVQLPSVPPTRFYAAFGLGGHSGVYSDFQTAVSTVGVDFSVMEYSNMDQAMAAVLKWCQHHVTVAAHLSNNHSMGTPFEPPGMAMPVAAGPLGMVSTVRERPRSAVPGPGDEGFFPTTKLMGPDPSKESDKFYGLEVGSEMALRRAMAPADVDDNVAKDLATAMLDAVAVPGTSGVSSGGDVDQQMTDLGLVGGAIQHLVDEAAQERMGRERIRFDSAWQSPSRNSLGSIKSADMLQPRFTDLAGLHEKVMKSFHRRLQNIYTNAGWCNTRAQAWAMTGYHAKISTGTYDAYVSLHLYLVSLANRGVPWLVLNTTIKHHVKKLGQIRSYSEGRLQALYEIYCYLRNGQAVNWFVAELQAERLLELQVATPIRSNVSSPDGAATRKVCPKCLSLVHMGDKAKCPWKDNSDKIAIAAANKVMANAATGLVEK